MRNIPLNIALAGLFAAGLAAQQAHDPKIELAHIIAVEEQEHDLDKAQRLYRAAMQDQKLSEAARRMARSRLHGLLVRLGKHEEAKALVASSSGKGIVVSLDDVTNQGQDVARQKQLQLQARELLAKSANKAPFQGRSELTGIPEDVASQLLWIGRPAVPEVVAELQAGIGEPNYGFSLRRNGLFEFLWRIGGPQASKFLVECAKAAVAPKDEPWHVEVAKKAAASAGAIERLDLETTEVRAYLEHPNWLVTQQFLGDGHKGPLVDRIETDQLLTATERASVSMRAFVLAKLRSRELSHEQLARVHQLVRAGLAGTDASYGNAAQLFLASSTSQQSTEGLLLLLQHLPELRRKRVPVGPRMFSGQVPRAIAENRHRPETYSRGLDPKSLSVLVPAIDVCVQAMGPVPEQRGNQFQWLHNLIFGVVDLGGADVLQHALAWWDQGYGLMPVLQGKITSENAAELLQRLDSIVSDAPAMGPFSATSQVMQFATYFQGVELPRDLFASLRDRAKATEDPAQRFAILTLMTATAHEEAAELVVAAWRDKRANASWAKDQLLQIARRNQSETVRSAMYSMVREFGGRDVSEKERVALLLALLSMGDERALDYATSRGQMTRVKHPYAAPERAWSLTPMQYLLYRKVEPAHPFTAEQVVAAARRFASNGAQAKGFDTRRWSVSEISDRCLVEFANTPGKHGQFWKSHAIQRLVEQLSAGQNDGVIKQWFEGVIGKSGFVSVMRVLDERVTSHYRDRIAALIDGNDEEWAYLAVRELWGLDRLVDVVKVLGNRHGKVRAWAAYKVRDGEAKVPSAALLKLLSDSHGPVRRLAAEHLGAIVAKEAVPGLISLLRDPDSEVRTVAADALTRIRFYHEQQAHWDRVLKGLDASTGSATEKLLLQAKASAPMQQRLLAIKSLGTLGAPEALPFLIEWTQDPDADVQKAAKAAITQIHLKPRK